MYWVAVVIFEASGLALGVGLVWLLHWLAFGINYGFDFDWERIGKWFFFAFLAFFPVSLFFIELLAHWVGLWWPGADVSHQINFEMPVLIAATMVSTTLSLLLILPENLLALRDSHRKARKKPAEEGAAPNRRGWKS